MVQAKMEKIQYYLEEILTEIEKDKEKIQRDYIGFCVSEIDAELCYT